MPPNPSLIREKDEIRGLVVYHTILLLNLESLQAGISDTKMPTSLRSKVLQGIAVGTLSSIGAFFVWTKHCKIEYLHPTSEPLFTNQWYKKLNVNANPTLHDECVRRLPLFKLKPELVEDAKNGGSKLVEGLSQGVWGGFGTSLQVSSFSLYTCA